MIINTETLELESVRHIRQATGVPLPRRPDAETLAQLTPSRAYVVEGEPPQGDVVEPNGFEQIDGEWRQAWSVRSYTDGEQAEKLADLANRQRNTIDAARDAAFAEGLPYTLPHGTDDVVQTRPEDKTNLLGLAVEARDLKAAGETGAVMEFRGESNITQNVTPQEMIDITGAALGYIKQVYAQSWARKDAIAAARDDEALTDDEKRAAIEAITWS